MVEVAKRNGAGPASLVRWPVKLWGSHNRTKALTLLFLSLQPGFYTARELHIQIPSVSYGYLRNRLPVWRGWCYLRGRERRRWTQGGTTTHTSEYALGAKGQRWLGKLPLGKRAEFLALLVPPDRAAAD